MRRCGAARLRSTGADSRVRIPPGANHCFFRDGVRMVARLQPAGRTGTFAGMNSMPQITDEKQTGINDDTQFLRQNFTEVLLQDTASRRYWGNAGDWTTNMERAAGFCSSQAALELARQLKFSSVRLVMTRKSGAW